MPGPRGGTIPGWVDKVLFAGAVAWLLIIILCLYLYVANLGGGN